jgi:predicted regulator of Ras-like GTPase activity (Roadblock/LC7/MglB family)
MMLSSALNGLRDVDDVHGSFLVGPEGELLARDLPAVFHAELFAEVGPRLARLRDTFDPTGAEPTSATLRFADHKIYLRSLGTSLLCVLTGAKVNVPALRMAMNLVARRVEARGVAASEFDEITTQVEVPPPSARAPVTPRTPSISGRTTLRSSLPAAPPPSTPPSSTTARHEVLYRGRRPV